MRSYRWVLLAMLLAVPFAVTAKAQVGVGVGVGVGPAVVGGGYDYADGYDYGPPVCDWGYYPYYPYACAPYGYYGPNGLYGGVFIGAGPWYGWGRGMGLADTDTVAADMATAGAVMATADAADMGTATAADTADALPMLEVRHVALSAAAARGLCRRRI